MSKVRPLLGAPRGRAAVIGSDGPAPRLERSDRPSVASSLPQPSGVCRRRAGPGAARGRCDWLCRVCPEGAQRGAKGRRKVAWRGLWGLFWAILLYSGELRPSWPHARLQSSWTALHPHAGANPARVGGVSGSKEGSHGAVVGLRVGLPVGSLGVAPRGDRDARGVAGSPATHYPSYDWRFGTHPTLVKDYEPGEYTP